MRYEKGSTTGGAIFAVLIWAAVIGSWITHLVVCFQGAKWGFLIAGAIFFPIGIVHGFGCWWGWW